MRLSPETLTENLTFFKTMLFERQHLAVTDIELKNLPGKAVLEVGCGVDSTSVVFSQHGALVVATDITPDRVELTQEIKFFAKQAKSRGIKG